eukprot:EC124133.1.p1 GENE.EC124133.1~~EC124133.1.p1  ORF type:complete len:132 (+),score=11.56 EC124133.1:115-510(+)
MVEFNLGLALRITSIISSVLFVIAAIVMLVFSHGAFCLELIIGIYFLLIAIIIVLAEFEVGVVYGPAPFLATLRGRGALFIILGVPMLTVAGGLGIAAGVVMILNGALFLGVSYKQGETDITGASAPFLAV